MHYTHHCAKLLFFLVTHLAYGAGAGIGPFRTVRTAVHICYGEVLINVNEVFTDAPESCQ